jgi:hypothetical protein
MIVLPVSFEWSEEKNDLLKMTRGICFEDVVAAIGTEDDLGVLPNINYPGQLILVVRIRGYVCKCPAVPTADGFFLKTLYPSRKATKKWGGIEE